MHPILFRIPLPHTPLRLWWLLAVVAVLALLSAGWSAFRRDRSSVVTAGFVALAAAGAGWKFHSFVFEGTSLPIYSYGVMLGLSLVIGWYLTLSLAAKDGLPKETMANCYVVTALSALAGARILYLATNPEDLKSIWDVFALRNGGLVAYGGFLGGWIGSWAYLAPKGIRLLAWADDAVPSLASGLFVTRIGCYLFGCDFGKRLPDGAPAWLKTAGTFPHWDVGTVANSDGSPAFVRHLDVYRGTALEAQLERMNTSFPVHPTQLYESLVGLLLLFVLIWQRKKIRFRGQLFFLFTFAYGFLRFLLELWRDDVERGSYGPMLDIHVYVPLCLVLMALGFVFGISLGIRNKQVRIAACAAAFVPAVVTFLALRPASFGETQPYQLSTSQGVGFLSALAVSYFYAHFWSQAIKAPKLAMSVGDPVAIAALEGDGPRDKGAAEGSSPGAAPSDPLSEPGTDEAPATGEAAAGTDSKSPEG
jgi:phosphatidylglycerol:prolipoprotein diacylglycerol transferase